MGRFRKSFLCGECGAHAFEDPVGVTRHGSPDAIEHDLGERHTALDPAGASPLSVDPAATRREAADQAFEAYDFGGVTIEGVDGWEGVTPGTELTRRLYLAGDEGESHRAYFTVRFRGLHTDAIAEAYAINTAGQLFGSPAQV